MDKMKQRSFKKLLDDEKAIVAYFMNSYIVDQKPKFIEVLRKKLEPKEVIFPDYSNFDFTKSEFISLIIQQEQAVIDWLSATDMENRISQITVIGNELYFVKIINNRRCLMSFNSLSTGTKQLLVYIYYSLLYKGSDVILIVDLYLHPLLARHIFDTLLEMKIQSIFLTNNRGVVETIMQNDSYKNKLVNIKTI